MTSACDASRKSKRMCMGVWGYGGVRGFGEGGGLCTPMGPQPGATSGARAVTGSWGAGCVPKVTRWRHTRKVCGGAAAGIVQKPRRKVGGRGGDA